MSQFNKAALLNKRPAWSTLLPRPITIPQVMTLKTRSPTCAN
jgi:hypothetical protein